MKHGGKWGVIYKVAWIYVLAVGTLLLPLYAIDFIFDSSAVNYIWKTPTGLCLLHLLGIIGLSYAIWDGEFVNDVKPSHWIWKMRKEEP